MLSTKEVAELLSKETGENISTETVANWRKRKIFGVPFFEADEKKNGAWLQQG